MNDNTQYYRCYFGTNDNEYFTKREAQVVSLLRFLNMQQIGKLYSLSPRSIEYYVSRVKMKLDVYSRVQLFEKLERYGFFDYEETAQYRSHNYEAKSFLAKLGIHNISEECIHYLSYCLAMMRNASV